MTLATLHLTGVTIAGVVAARLTDPLHEVTLACVNVGAGEELSPGSSSHLTPGHTIQLKVTDQCQLTFRSKSLVLCSTGRG